MSALRFALAAVLAAAVMLGLAAPARAGCITRLPARVHFPTGRMRPPTRAGSTSASNHAGGA